MRQITHGGKIALALLVYPAEQLGGTKAFFTQLCAPLHQTFQIKIEQIGARCVHGQMLNCLLAGMNIHAGKEEGDFYGGCFRRIRAMHGVGIDAVGEVCADGAFVGLFRVGGAH